MSKAWRRNSYTMNPGSSRMSKPISYDESSSSELGSPVCSVYEQEINESTDKKFPVTKYKKGSKHSLLNQDEYKLIKNMDKDGHKGNKRQPFHVPRNPSFFLHDLRITEEEEEVREENDADNETEYKCWKHDMYDEEEQQPKSRREIVDSYGYDIRSDNRTSTRYRRYNRKQKDKNENYIDSCSDSYKDEDLPCHPNLKKNNKISKTQFRDKHIKPETCHKNIKVENDHSPETLSVMEKALSKEISVTCVEEIKANTNLSTYCQSKNPRRKCSSGAFPIIPLKKPPALKKLDVVKSIKDISPEECKYFHNSDTAANFTEMIIFTNQERLLSSFKESIAHGSKDCEQSSKHQKPLQNQIHNKEMQNTGEDKQYQFHTKMVKAEYPLVHECKNHGSSDRVHSPVNVTNREIIKAEDDPAYKHKKYGSFDRVHPSLTVATKPQNCDSYNLISRPVENCKTFSFPDPPDVSANHLTPWMPQQQYHLQPYYQQGVGSILSTGCYAYQGYYQGRSVAIMKQFFSAYPSSFHHSALSHQAIPSDPFYISQNNGGRCLSVNSDLPLQLHTLDLHQ